MRLRLSIVEIWRNAQVVALEQGRIGPVVLRVAISRQVAIQLLHQARFAHATFGSDYRQPGAIAAGDGIIGVYQLFQLGIAAAKDIAPVWRWIHDGPLIVFLFLA